MVFYHFMMFHSFHSVSSFKPRLSTASPAIWWKPDWGLGSTLWRFHLFGPGTFWSWEAQWTNSIGLMLKKLVSGSQSTLHIHCIYLWYTRSRSLDCHGKARSQSGHLKSFQGTPKNTRPAILRTMIVCHRFLGCLLTPPRKLQGQWCRVPWIRAVANQLMLPVRHEWVVSARRWGGSCVEILWGDDEWIGSARNVRLID